MSILKLPESLLLPFPSICPVGHTAHPILHSFRDLIGNGRILGWKKDSSSQASTVVKIENTISEITISVIQNSLRLRIGSVVWNNSLIVTPN
jgi:hypothetical protein